MINTKIETEATKTAIVVEDQCTTWDYISGILEKDFQIKAFCNSSKLAESAFMEYKPDLVWLDCYLGELCESNLGLKNSGLLLAEWMKKHNSFELFLEMVNNITGDTTEETQVKSNISNMSDLTVFLTDLCHRRYEMIISDYPKLTPEQLITKEKVQSYLNNISHLN